MATGNSPYRIVLSPVQRVENLIGTDLPALGVFDDDDFSTRLEGTRVEVIVRSAMSLGSEVDFDSDGTVVEERTRVESDTVGSRTSETGRNVSDDIASVLDAPEVLVAVLVSKIGGE